MVGAVMKPVFFEFLMDPTYQCADASVYDAFVVAFWRQDITTSILVPK